MKDQLLKGIREKALRTLARSGRYDAMHTLHGYLNQYGLTEHIERGERAAKAGDLDTEAGLRMFINTIR